MDKLKLHSPDFTDENIRKLAELFPGCVTEDKDEEGNIKKSIDFDQLRQEFSKNIVEGPRERYSLNWPGKREALLTANAPIAKTLRPCQEESVDFDTTQNLFIEGDNLDALKLMQETYLGKIKMIYIDPPYNTGNDFIYEDDFAQNSEEFLKKSNQKDEEGNRLVANTESNGRFHSDWLSMMYSRLKLARNLLKDDGVIFISIDDNEVSNLKKICDEIFGSENFITQFIWEKAHHFGRQKINYYSNADYVLCYSKNIYEAGIKKELLVERIKTEHEDAPLYNASNPENILTFPPKTVKFNLNDGKYDMSTDEKYKLLSPVTVNNGFNENEFKLKFRSRWSPSKVINELKNGVQYWVKSENFSIRVIYGKDKTSKESPRQIIFTNPNNPFCVYGRLNNKVGTNEEGSGILTKIMDVDIGYLYPKPPSLIMYFVSMLFSKNNFPKDDIILDFFAGSATTAHAVMQLNAEDKGSRKFIMIQLPESCDDKSEAYKAGFKTIADIGKERIRRVGKKIKEENAATAPDLDVGFRVFKVDSSNMRDVYYNPDAYSQDTLFEMTDNIKPDRTDEDLLFQVLLDWGVDLSLPVSKEKIAGNDVFFVSENALAACFVKKGEITEDFCKELAKREPLRVVFRDAGFKDDSMKINVEQIFKLASPHTEVKTI